MEQFEGSVTPGSVRPETAQPVDTLSPLQETVATPEKPSPLAIAQAMLREALAQEKIIKILEKVVDWTQTDALAGVKVMAAYNAALIVPPVVQNWDKVTALFK